MEKKERYKKSEKYKGVYQRKDGTWFYRYKRIFEKDSKPVYFQKGGFLTDKIAYEARMTDIKLSQATSRSERKENTLKTFGEYFRDFLENGCDSDASKKKYDSLYSAQLKIWEDRNIHTISEADIENLLLSLSIYKGTYIDKDTGKEKFKGYSESYLSSFRKMLKVFYKYLHTEYGVVSGDRSQNIDTKPQKLRVLSLFSGIGAPERALENIGVNFELVNFCEFDDNAAFAYHLLHNVPLDKDLTDVENIDEDYCKQVLPDFDIMVFGSPCQDFSRNGEQKGLFKEPDTPLPTTKELYFDELNSEELTRSGLIYRALQIAIWKKPKFMLIENVEALLSETFKKEFDAILRHLQDIGYNIHFKKLNSRDFGVPQNRPRVFMVVIRDDLNIDFKFPEPIPLDVMAKDWFQKDAADEYYIDPADYSKLNRESYAL